MQESPWTRYSCFSSTAHPKGSLFFLIKKRKLRNRVLDSLHLQWTKSSQSPQLRYNAFKTSAGTLDLWLGIFLLGNITSPTNSPLGLMKQRPFAEHLSQHIASLWPRIMYQNIRHRTLPWKRQNYSAPLSKSLRLLRAICRTMRKSVPKKNTTKRIKHEIYPIKLCPLPKATRTISSVQKNYD